MDVKLGDVYIRNSDEKIYRVKKKVSEIRIPYPFHIDNTIIVLESLEDEGQLAITDIFGIEKEYPRKESVQ